VAFCTKRATYARTPGRPQACVQKHSARHGHCFREALRAHTHLVVRQQAFALDAPRDPSLAILVPDHASWRCDSRRWLRSHEPHRRSSSLVPSLVQPRRQSPKRPARGQTRIAACLATPQRLAHGLATLRKGHQVVCVHDLVINARGAPRPTGGKCRRQSERIDNASHDQMSRFSEYGLFQSFVYEISS